MENGGSRVHARISDIRHSDENFEGVLFIRLAYAPLNLTLDFCLPLLAVTAIEGETLHQLDEARGGKTSLFTC